jgi:hypothetical protein
MVQAVLNLRLTFYVYYHYVLLSRLHFWNFGLEGSLGWELREVSCQTPDRMESTCFSITTFVIIHEPRFLSQNPASAVFRDMTTYPTAAAIPSHPSLHS